MSLEDAMRDHQEFCDEECRDAQAGGSTTFTFDSGSLTAPGGGGGGEAWTSVTGNCRTCGQPVPGGGHRFDCTGLAG